ncbi:MAG: hypothetical protein F4137_02315 [Acidobacteria bacterium]|nr:hypothetical protein [Acidobacteriota bacterium]
MSGSLDHALIRQLFDELSAALEARGVRGHVYLIGGGAMITGYGRDRTTKDVDVRIDEAKDEVLAAAAAIGERYGLDERWLDLGAAQFVPRGDDVRAKTVHNSPGLLVTGASAEHLLAMKVFAGRRPDLDDIKHLAGILGIRRTSTAIRICERAYPGWLVMERTRRNVGDAIADARAERGEPVPELTLERNTTLRAEGAGSRSYEIMAEEQADGSETLHVTVRDPAAPDHDEQRPVRRVYGAPGPIRTLKGANVAVHAYERQARTRDGMAPMETPVELKRVEVLRVEGERGRRYRAEWIRSGAAADWLDVSVTDLSSADDEQGDHERVLQRTRGDGVVRSIEQANEVINRYEQEAAAQDRRGAEGRELLRTGGDPAVQAPQRPNKRRSGPDGRNPSTTGSKPQSEAAGPNGETDSSTSRARRVLPHMG